MITAYRVNGDAVALTVADAVSALPPDTVWLDIDCPTREEDRFAERLAGIAVPTREDLRDIEPSSRLYTVDNAHYLTASLICHADSTTPVLADVAFVLTDSLLVTVRYDNPKSFDLFKASIGRVPAGLPTAHAALTRLMETIVDRTAEILEMAEMRDDALLGRIFATDGQTPSRRPPKTLETLLTDIALHHRLVSKVRASLASLARVITYVNTLPSIKDDRETRTICRSIARDVQSLSEHASFLSSNISFLLDASLGLINVEQNAIIKIFSIASVVFLPPTLVASIYGMNFKFMPELDWSFGYPSSLLVMVVSAIIPFFFFRWKGWL